jgi:hypothetical protein
MEVPSEGETCTHLDNSVYMYMVYSLLGDLYCVFDSKQVTECARLLFNSRSFDVKVVCSGFRSCS